MIERSVKRQKYKLSEGDLILNYGKDGDPSIPISKISYCAGCGANFQCNSASLPGFLPIEVFYKVEEQSKRFSGFREHMCRRCYLSKKYNFLVKLSYKIIKIIF